MTELDKAFGSLLRELRNERALSQETLAAEAGLARNYISQLELGSKCPSLRSVFKLCKVLGVAPGDVVGEVDRRAKLSGSSTY
ncbi:helix-turn-helix domain-containing protein [Delftia sp. K82]|uniref:helix-turn-helix domain-containing protein n=1 Tax=Delftia sp. K82 TaxID=1472718 RepID=UPI000B48B164|nr:helix-turn-helix transcriptional regulator [Delftia sp. K82]